MSGQVMEVMKVMEVMAARSAHGALACPGFCTSITVIASITVITRDPNGVRE
jgi:hypothetical protein